MVSQERISEINTYLEKEARIIPFSILKNIVKELKLTKPLRDDIIKNPEYKSFLGKGIEYLKSKGVPGADILERGSNAAYSTLLNADTVLAAMLRGKAKPDSYRYKAFTKENNFVRNAAGSNQYTKIPRASLTPPLVAFSEGAIPILAGMKLEDLRDTKESQNPGGL